ncbi:methyl-accepting chemotaxis protein [Geofilum rubicundum]|uniref:Methyl-accepting chemotaxis protein n=1 Tax=Geofilum rubicundum JCM 15548 TaxID=1236989 RepID=A0A0E9LY49_9BACT|nr:methyl-accepting chemotaxis protein [Geofilum rubicundum]GAO30487.1 methyl-accepting chemotaxis protein [Geofilum rubicundum JCM 15548]
MQFFAKIRNKILFFTGITLTSLALIITLLFGTITYRASERQVADLETRLMSAFDRLLQSEVETAVSMLQGFADKVDSGELEEEPAKELAAYMLKNLFYGEDGYFFTDTKEGIHVSMPGTEHLVGTSRLDYVDANGNLFVKNIIDVALSGGGVTEYWFPKLGSDIAMPKRSYSIYFEPFEWVVGTGLYYDDIDTVINETKEARKKEAFSTIVIVLITTLLLTIIGVIIAYFIGKKISTPIEKLSGKTEQVSTGDLNVDIAISTNDEVGVLEKSLEAMIHRLRQIVHEIHEGASNVVTASQQMSAASQVIADGASEQAASTEEISTSMEEMVSSILQNTSNAQQTDKIAVDSAQQIIKLREAFHETLEAMKKITERSSVIKDISFQTNILSLNAAVEAARAGEAGRGFSVVAGEVRKLSESTQKAALEIDALTKNSLQVAQDTWEMLEQLVPEFEKTAELVKEISASGEEQRIGADMINNAIQSLMQVTNQNSAASEELASSSEELAAQAETLKEAIGFFRA